MQMRAHLGIRSRAPDGTVPPSLPTRAHVFGFSDFLHSALCTLHVTLCTLLVQGALYTNRLSTAVSALGPKAERAGARRGRECGVQLAGNGEVPFSDSDIRVYLNLSFMPREGVRV